MLGVPGAEAELVLVLVLAGEKGRAAQGRAEVLTRATVMGLAASLAVEEGWAMSRARRTWRLHYDAPVYEEHGERCRMNWVQQ